MWMACLLRQWRQFAWCVQRLAPAKKIELSSQDEAALQTEQALPLLIIKVHTTSDNQKTVSPISKINEQL